MQKTIKNLAAAFIGESQARNRYTMYAKTAKKEGYVQISEIFLETADHEKQHAKWLMTMIQDLKKDASDDYEEISLEALCPTKVGTTAENLKAAIEGENHEQTSMYPEFAKVAEEEGLEDVAKRLMAIGKAEAHHEERYKKLLDVVEAKTVFKKSNEVSWLCKECGYEHYGEEAPEVCPACSHPQGYYQLKNESY